MFPDSSVDFLYNKVVIDPSLKGANYYNSMLRVAYDMMLIKRYSLMVDEFIHLKKKIISEEIDIEELKEKVFVDSDVAKYFSNKQFCLFIRNAFNHNSKEKDLYRISRNGKFIEIHLSLEGRFPKPFHIKMSMDQFSDLNNKIAAVGRNILTTEFNTDNVDFSKEDGYLENELKKVEFKRRYFKDKFELSDIAELSKNLYTEFESREVAEQNVNEWIDNIDNYEHVIKSFKLDKEQRVQSANKIKYFKDEFAESYEEIEPFLVRNAMLSTMPIGAINSNRMIMDLLINNFLFTKSSSLNSIGEFINSSLFGEERVLTEPYMESLRQFIVLSNPNRQSKLETHIESLDLRQRSYNATMMYFEFLLKEFITDEELKKLPSEFTTMRNALTHGRHYLGDSIEAQFYDSCGRGKNDYEFGEHISVGLDKISVFASNIYDDRVVGNKKQYKKKVD